MEDNFVYLCSSLCSFCVLTIPLCSDHFTLQTDASGRGISAVCSVCRDGAELSIAFYSCQLRGGQLNYSATELECLAVKESVHHFEVYLHGQTFKVQTDHRALDSLLTSTHLNSTLTQWTLYLQGFAMKRVYRPGSNNANGLSKQAWNEDMADEDVKPSEGERCQVTPLTGGPRPPISIKT